MATLAKIKEVRLYFGLTENSAECYNLKKLLDDNNIPYVVLHYIDEQFESVFNSLGTWNWGTERAVKKFTDFPILTWAECYDDFERYPCCITSSSEFSTCSLMINKDLIQTEEN